VSERDPASTRRFREAEEAPAAAVDLMAALKASVERAKKARGEAPEERAREVSATPIGAAKSAAKKTSSGTATKSTTAKKAAPAKKSAAAKKATPAAKATAAPAKSTAAKKAPAKKVTPATKAAKKSA
jgi:DNA end-binding protein Ku